MKGRGFESSSKYRFGFQGQESDKEMWDGAVSYKYRVHDPRLGRFFSVDPLAPEYPWNSPYAFSENVLINAVELEGLEKEFTYDAMAYGGDVAFKLQQSNPLYQAGVKFEKWLDKVTKAANVRFFKAYYPQGSLARKLIDNFAYGEGATYKMTRTDIIEIYPRFGWDENTGGVAELNRDITPIEFNEFGKQLQGDVTAIPYEKNGIRGYAATGGTLGRSYQSVEGTISRDQNDKLVFRGTMHFYDEWDFNVDPTRAEGASRLTAVGRNLLIGKGFKINGSIEVIQYEGQKMKILSTGDDSINTNNTGSKETMPDLLPDAGEHTEHTKLKT